LPSELSAVPALLEQFQEQCGSVEFGAFAVTVRPELREYKDLERFSDSLKR